MNLKDQVIIITGAGGGIGRATSLICAGYGSTSRRTWRVRRCG